MSESILSTAGSATARRSRPTKVVFLCWESPWPAHSGAALRTWGLLKEISRSYPVDLLLLTRRSLSDEQVAILSQYASSITRIALRDVGLADKTRAVFNGILRTLPYHNSVLLTSIQNHPEIRQRILDFPGIVFTSNGHWGSIVGQRRARNWILNQCDADVEFWRVYASQASDVASRLAAQLNYRLAQRHFPAIYANVGRIISVCEEDRQLTQALASGTPVDVIENGVDCAYLNPDRSSGNDRPQLLFTGTSAGRNVSALRQFVHDTLPLIQQQVPDTELLVAGNFSQRSQMEFRSVAGIHFTGWVDDIRPYFNQSDVFISPFQETHGSKLKVAEAMAMAMPIVSTPQGVRGFDLTYGQSVLIAHNTEQFAAHCVMLLRSPERRAALGAAARDTALATIDWQVLGKRLANIVDDTFRGLAEARGRGES